MTTYEFQGVENLVLNIISYIYAADEDMAANGITGTQLRQVKWIQGYQYDFSSTIAVRGQVRGSSEPVVTTLPLSVEIEPTTTEPLEIIKKFKATDYWNVNIKLPPLDPTIGGNCFYMGLCIPRNSATSEPKVLITWIYQIMINPANHTQVAAPLCLGPSAPNYQWGTLFMQLFEMINKVLSVQVHPMILSGLVDDAFVQYCGHPVVFSDLRRFQGQAPWYEAFGFKMANIKEYEMALDPKTYLLARQSVESNYNFYIQEQSDCSASPMSVQEKQLFCRNDPSCSMLQYRKEVAQHIAEAIRNNDEVHGCSWISDNAPLTCLTQFNRHYNPQTLRIAGENGEKEELVVRLKFYSM